MGKVLHEADRVSKQKGQVAGGVDPADGGIQCREQHVCLEDPFVLRLHIIRRGCFFQEIRIRELKTAGLSCSAAVIQEGVHDGRLARIGVADQGDPGETGPQAPAPLRGTLAVHDLQVPPQLRQPLFDPSAVQLQLLLTGALVGQAAASTALAGEGGPHADEAGQHVLELGGLDLELGLAGPGPGGKDLQDQAGPVQDLRVQLLFQVAHLHGGQGLVEEDDVCIPGLDLAAQLHDLAAAQIGGVGDVVGVLHDGAGRLESAGFGQAAELRDHAGVPVRGESGIAACQDGAWTGARCGARCRFFSCSRPVSFCPGKTLCPGKIFCLRKTLCFGMITCPGTIPCLRKTLCFRTILCFGYIVCFFEILCCSEIIRSREGPVLIYVKPGAVPPPSYKQMILVVIPAGAPAG